MKYNICKKCIMDTSDPLIQFDDDGVCNHCKKYNDHLARIGSDEQRLAKLNHIVAEIKKSGIGKDYDCIMGLSGGVDSSFLAHYAVNILGLRPLVVHVDSGWNSELAVSNIESICKILKIDLHTLVIDWPEMKDLQRAYFLSGVPNLDVPQDHAFNAAMISEAKKYKIKHVLNGGNMQTESILPSEWGYDANDAVSLIGIHKKYGRIKLKNYPIRGDFQRLIYDPYIYKMRVHRPLEYINYNKVEAKVLLQKELSWRDYGGKHYESRFTKFFQAHYLPQKFNYDKRRAHLSSLIVSNQLTRDQAIVEMKKPLYDELELKQDREYFCKKLGLSIDEYYAKMKEAPRTHRDYPNREASYMLIKKLYKRLSSLKNSIFKKS